MSETDIDSRIVRVLIVEDQPVVRAGLRISLGKIQRLSVVGESSDGEGAIAKVKTLHPDVVLMDMRLPGMDGIEATWHIKHESPRTRVLMFTSCADYDDITGAFGAGADGYCLKEASTEQIERAVRSVARGEVWIDPLLAEGVLVQVEPRETTNNQRYKALTSTEIRILELISDGLQSIGIAHNLQMDAEEVNAVMRDIISRYSMDSSPGEKTASSVSNPKIDPASPRTFTREWYAATTAAPEGIVVAERYSLEQLLGSGGIGTVFKAKHIYMDRTVALKLLQPKYNEDPQVIRAFQQEASTLANCKHKNIVDVYDFGITELDQPYLVMEYVDGADLDKVLQLEENRRLSYQRFLSIFIQVCEGLAAAHARNVIHCDLKPSNIFVLKDADGVEQVKIVDFGLAKLVPLNPTAQSQATDRFMVNGTPSYMPPEQCAGINIDQRSDIYALGSVMYEALGGINPFSGKTAMETFAKQFEFRPPPVSCFCPDIEIPQELDQCITTMLAKNPKHRYQSVQEILWILQKLKSQCSA